MLHATIKAPCLSLSMVLPVRHQCPLLPCLRQANRAMEVEMLEEQLHRAKKDNAALRQRLEAAMATLATMASPSMPLMQRMAQVRGVAVFGIAVCILALGAAP